MAETAEQVASAVGGFDNGPCYWCAREAPCACGPYTPASCRCTCGRCQYPFPLVDDGPEEATG